MAATFFTWFTCHAYWHIEAYLPCRYGTWSHMEKLPLGPLFLSLSNMHSSWARVSDKAKEVNLWNPLNLCTFSQVPHDLICAKQPHHATSSGAKWPWWLKQTSFSWRCFSTLVALEWKVHFVIFEVMSMEVGTGSTNATRIWHHFASWFDLLRHGAKSDTLGPTIRESWGIQFDHLRLHWRGWRWSRSNVGRWRGHVIR